MKRFCWLARINDLFLFWFCFLPFFISFWRFTFSSIFLFLPLGLSLSLFHFGMFGLASKIYLFIIQMNFFLSQSLLYFSFSRLANKQSTNGQPTRIGIITMIIIITIIRLKSFFSIVFIWLRIQFPIKNNHHQHHHHHPYTMDRFHAIAIIEACAHNNLKHTYFFPFDSWLLRLRTIKE